MNDHSGRCCERTPHNDGSWIRPHVCRLEPHDATHPHQCTCNFEWTAHHDVRESA